MNTKTNEQRAADAAANKQLLADANKKVADVNAEITQNGLLHISFGAMAYCFVTARAVIATRSGSLREQATKGK